MQRNSRFPRPVTRSQRLSPALYAAAFPRRERSRPGVAQRSGGVAGACQTPPDPACAGPVAGSPGPGPGRRAPRLCTSFRGRGCSSPCGHGAQRLSEVPAPRSRECCPPLRRRRAVSVEQAAGGSHPAVGRPLMSTRLERGVRFVGIWVPCPWRLCLLCRLLTCFARKAARP